MRTYKETTRFTKFMFDNDTWDKLCDKFGIKNNVEWFEIEYEVMDTSWDWQ